MPQSVMDAAKLPSKTTPTHVYFFGYELPEPASTFVLSRKLLTKRKMPLETKFIA